MVRKLPTKSSINPRFTYMIIGNRIIIRTKQTLGSAQPASFLYYDLHLWTNQALSQPKLNHRGRTGDILFRCHIQCLSNFFSTWCVFSGHAILTTSEALCCLTAFPNAWLCTILQLSQFYLLFTFTETSHFRNNISSDH